MDCQEALDYIFALPKLANKLGCESLGILLNSLGRPQDKLKFVHILGTNGKGSAAAMLGSILEKSGYKTGVYTSPYLITFNERIKIGTDPISDADLAEYTAKVRHALDTHGLSLSQFAFITAVALVYYADKACDAVILEAGLGGRLDATNVIDESLATVIMSISLDHTELLGDTVEKIAAEKCGAIKQGGRVVSYRNSQAVNSVTEAFAKERNARLYLADEASPTKCGVKISDREYELSLTGDFQAKNAAAVIKTVEVLREQGFNIPESAVADGLKSTVHHCRFEKIGDNIIIDGAHNPDAVNALCGSLNGIKGKKSAIIAMMSDKDCTNSLRKLGNTFDEVTVTELDMPRCMKKESLCDLCKKIGLNAVIAPTPQTAFSSIKDDRLTVIFGSIYLAGEAMKYFNNHRR